MGQRPRIEGADQAVQFAGRTLPVNRRDLLVQLVGVGRQGVVLHFALQGSGSQTFDCLDYRRWAQFGQPVVQTAAGVFAADRGADLEQHRSGVQPGFHLHHGHAGFAVTRFDRALNRRRAAPARQQRGMAVDAAQAGNIQYRLRQDQTVGHHYQQIGPEVGQRLLVCRVTQPFRLHYRQAMLERECLDRTHRQFLAAAGGPVGLRVDGHDIQPGINQRLQMGGGKVRCSGKNDT